MVRCHVDSVLSGDPASEWEFELSYVDPSQDSGVRAVLIRADNSAVLEELAVINSKDFGGSPAPQTQRQRFSHRFDFAKYTYYVDIRVGRTELDFRPAALAGPRGPCQSMRPSRPDSHLR